VLPRIERVADTSKGCDLADPLLESLYSNARRQHVGPDDARCDIVMASWTSAAFGSVTAVQTSTGRACVRGRRRTQTWVSGLTTPGLG
jgi:hypothetical protein